MQQKLQLSTPSEKPNPRDKIISITDIAFHVHKMGVTASPWQKIKKIFKKNKPQRVYSSPTKEVFDDQNQFILNLLQKDPEFIQMLEEEHRNGCKVYLHIPKGGIPAAAAKDTADFINSIKGKRILRRLYKNKPEE